MVLRPGAVVEPGPERAQPPAQCARHGVALARQEYVAGCPAQQQGQAPQKTLYISIVEQDKTTSGQSKEHKGVWNFKLENADY